MKNITLKTIKLTSLFVLSTTLGISQESAKPTIVVSGEPLAQALVKQWILDYNKTNTGTIIFKSKAKKSDLAIEFIDSEKPNKDLKHFTIAKVAIVPVAKTTSQVAAEFGKKGLDKNELKSLFFDDFLATTGKNVFSKIPYQVYTRLGETGVPFIFSKAFGYQTSNIKGNAILGNDLHVLMAIQNDAQAVTFNALNLLYDPETRKPLKGLTILPVDLDGNDRVSSEESIYQDLDTALQHLQALNPKDIENLPIGQLQIVVNLKEANEQTLSFLNWILENGQQNLTKFGFLKPDVKVLQKESLAVNQLVLNK